MMLAKEIFSGLGYCNLFATLGVSLALFVGLGCYRAFLSPLTKFPGPKIAAATDWYEFYFDCVLVGRFSQEIARLHQVYGDIVRVSPWEVHIKDPDFFNQLFSTTMKLDKDSWYYRFVGSPKSSFATGDAQLHRLRRNAMARLFSKASVLRSISLIENNIKILIARFEVHKEAGKVVDLSNALRCLTFDIASDFALPSSKGNLLHEDFSPQFNLMFRTLAHIALWHRHFGFLIPLMLSLPYCVVKRLAHPKYLSVINFQRDLKAQATEVVASGGSSWAKQQHPTLLHSIVNADIPQKEKSIDRITQEAVTVIGAGTEAAAGPMAEMIFGLLSKPKKALRLKEELNALEPNRTTYLTYDMVQTLPYLSAVISEGFRLGKESGRMPRISKLPINYKSWVIPAGTVISMSLADMHLDEEIFDDPHEFRPERWLDPQKKIKQERYLVPFSRGSRGCLGQSLAIAEVYLTIANLMHRFDLHLFQTSKMDVARAHDFFAPEGPIDSKGLRVMVH